MNQIVRHVAVFRHARSEGPGYFGIFLENHGISWQLIPIDEDAPLPETPGDYCGLCFMGGPMNANDPLPWIDKLCALIRAAVADGIPVIGHCLGGQLIGKALGGTVSPNPVKEIGWGAVSAGADETARHWLGEFAGKRVEVFHWHGQTFSIPPGASRILSGESCANQAFVLGPHLALQCHIEMTPEMVQRWCRGWQKETAALDPLPPSVQTPEAMQKETPQRLPAMRRLADRLYGVWIQGLAG